MKQTDPERLKAKSLMPTLEAVQLRTHWQLTDLLIRLFDELDEGLVSLVSKEEAQRDYVEACARVELARQDLKENGCNLVLVWRQQYQFTTKQFREAWAASWHAARLYTRVMRTRGGPDCSDQPLTPIGGLLLSSEQDVKNDLQSLRQQLAPSAFVNVAFDVLFSLYRG